MMIHILIDIDTNLIVGCYFDLSKAERKKEELKKMFPYKEYKIKDHWVEWEGRKIMCDIIDFVMESKDEIVSYEVFYYDYEKVECGEPIGEVTFTMKDDDTITFQIC